MLHDRRRKEAPRRRRAVCLVVAGVFMTVAALAFALPAFGHDVTGVSATCDHVTVNWSGFPAAGVPVHINIQVGAVGSISADVTVKDTTTHTDVNIAALTSQLHDQTAPVDDLRSSNYRRRFVYENKSGK